MHRSFVSRRRASLVAVISVTIAVAFPVTTAWAGPGYQLDGTKSSILLTAELPIGLAIDQSSQNLYVAEATKSLSSAAPGQIEQLSSSGAPTVDSPFTTGGQDLFSAVAVNPVNQGIYAYQLQAQSPVGPIGTSKMSFFSSTGALGSSFFPPNAFVTSLAADAAGRVIFPNSFAGSVQIYSSSGTVEATVTCSGCTGGAFQEPTGVALDSNGNLYVVDKVGGGRVVKLAPSGGSYSYQSTFQSGAGATAVGVDPSSNDVFVGDNAGASYHVVAYNSSGVPFDDFALGLATEPAQASGGTGQLAVNETTHKLYISDSGRNKLWAFERIASIPAPSAGVIVPSEVGQVGATLQASVEPKGHVLTSCRFEYTDHADFLANGYANAHVANCPGLVGGSATTISAKANGLTPSTTYDYRVQVGSYGGSAEAGPQTFETLPPLPPEATTGTASALAPTSATLAGTVNPKGGVISNCHFEWVTEAAFQATGFAGASSKACSVTPTGNVASPVLAKVAGLIAATAYRYRVVATNNSGVGTATDGAFTTPAETCSENAALCPPSEEGSPPVSSLPTPLAPVTSPPASQPRRLKCHRGFKKKRVRGKLKCVKVKKPRARR